MNESRGRRSSPRKTLLTLLVLSASCATTPPMEDVDTLPDAECAVLTEVVDGFEVTIVGPTRPPPVQPQPLVRLAAAKGKTGQLFASSPRLLETVRTLMRDRFLGNFVQAMAADPDVSYYLWDNDELQRNGGGVTTHCNKNRFDIWLNINYHVSQEGTACSNPRGSGSLRSLLAHELGHAWIWRWFDEIAYCDNKARTNVTAVAWENTQLVGGAQRFLHNPPGCPCVE